MRTRYATIHQRRMHMAGDRGALAMSALRHWLLVATALLHIDLYILKKVRTIREMSLI